MILVYLDGDIVRYIGEDSDVDVPAGGEAEAEIVADYMGTFVTAPESAEVGVVYSVWWMARPHTTGYELQEATSADFSGAVSLYAGTYVSVDVEPKDVAGITYYYRARSTTFYGNGPWHSTGMAATRTYAEEGTIIIDVPIPPDEPPAVATFELPGGATMEFVWIEPGTFVMGTTDEQESLLRSKDLWESRFENEHPAHEVTISQGFNWESTKSLRRSGNLQWGRNPGRGRTSCRRVRRMQHHTSRGTTCRRSSNS